jgi:hypothetical protein
VAIGQQKSGGGDRAPARDFAQLVVGAADIAVQPARGVRHCVQHARAELAVIAGKQQRRMDQPAE